MTGSMQIAFGKNEWLYVFLTKEGVEAHQHRLGCQPRWWSEKEDTHKRKVNTRTCRVGVFLCRFQPRVMRMRSRVVRG